MTPETIEAILNEKFPGSVVGVIDMTGTGDHFEVRMSWEGFRGQGLIQQHRLVNEALRDRIDDGSIHALKIKTTIPEKQG